MTTKHFKASPSDAGCWIDESRGWRATAYLVTLAREMGCTDIPDDIVVISRNICTGAWISNNLVEDVEEYVGIAEDYMNAHVAPEGYHFDWHEGGYYLLEDEKDA